MSNSQNIKLLNNLVRSQERRKFYSTNTNKKTNTYKCPDHNEFFSKICLNCNLDICTKCEKNYHNNHIIIKYDDIIPDSSEIEDLKNILNIYINKYNNLKKEINNWYTEIKNKINDYNISLKNNEIVNSRDFITNYSNNKICLNTILKFRKIYYNIMEENNTKNKKIISLLNKYISIDNINLPSYYDYIEINNILHKLNYNKDNLMKKTELLLNYLLSITTPYSGGGSNNSISKFNINNNNETLTKSNSYYNNTYKNPFLMNSNDIKFVDVLGEKNTDMNNLNYNSNSEKRVYNTKTNEFKNILNKTKIPEFDLNTYINYSNQSNKTINLDDNKNNKVKNFTKFLNTIGVINTNTDLHKENSSQDLLNKSSCSIKSTKIVPNRSYSTTFNVNENKSTSNLLGIKSTLLSNNFLSKQNKEIINTEKGKGKEKENNRKIYLEKTTLYNNKNAQIKTYVHKKFNNNKTDDHKKNNYTIKFQKKIIANKNMNNLQHISQKEKLKEVPKIFSNTESIEATSEIDKEREKYYTFNYNNSSLMSNRIYKTKQKNDEILKNNNEKMNNICSSPIKPEMLKNTIIGNMKKQVSNFNNKNNYNNNINIISEINNNNNKSTTENKNLLHIVYSPLLNRNPNFILNNKKIINTNKTNKSNNNNNMNYQAYKINNNTNVTISPPNIIKTNKNSPFFVDPEKDINIGLELGNSECKVGIVSQNTGEIQLVCFDEDKYSIPTYVSFGENKKEIKIGYNALEDIYANPSQTIFNIIKFFGKKYNEIKARKEFWPFKIYYANNVDNKPYIKINFGPQKDKIFYFENILYIFLAKMFDIVFSKVNLENSSNRNTTHKKKSNEKDLDKDIIKNDILTTLNISLVLTVPNYFNYYQRKLIEKIIRDVIFPNINDSSDNEGLKIYGQYKINLINLRIENASSIASLCLNINYDYSNNIKNNNILILNIDGGSINISITSSYNENDKPIYLVKAMKGISKGGTDLIDDFMLEILDKFDKEVKKEILDSPLALVKLRKICENIRINLLTKEKDTFNIMDILSNYNEQIEIKRSDYDKSSFYFYNNIRILIYDCLNEAKLKEKDITDILFIGELCKDKKLVEMIERSFIQENTFLFEKLIYSNYIDNEKDFYIMGGAAYHSINTRKNKNNNLYLFNDISPFNIGIEKYNGKLDYIIMKGDTIPVKNKKTIKIENKNEINIFENYEGNENNNNNILLGKIQIDDNDNIWMDNIKYGYKEIKIEYEINDKLEIIIRIFNGKNYGNDKKLRLI